MADPKNKSAVLAKSAILFSIVTTFSLVLSFAKESILAYYFGTSAEMDAYTLAIQLPVTLFGTISTAINTVVVPNYSNELINKGSKDASRYVSNLICFFVLASTVLVTICIIFGRQVISIIAPGLEGQSKDLAVLIFQLVVPTIILTEIMHINTGVVNVHKSYVAPAFSAYFLNVVFILTVVIGYSRYGIYAAVIGVIVGTIAEFCYLTICRRQYVKIKPIIDLKDPALKRSAKMAVPVFIGGGAAEINKLIDRMIASFLTTGSIASLSYASKLSSAISSLLIRAVSTIAFPEFAESAAKNDKQSLSSKFLIAIRLYVFIITPLIFGGAFLNKEIIRVIFMRGSFNEGSVNSTAPLFTCYIACLLFQSIRLAGANYFYACGDSKTPMKNSVIGIAINLVLNIILSKYIGALGLALATLISAIIISCLLLNNVKKVNEIVTYKSIGIVSIKSICASVAMYLILISIHVLLFSKFDYIAASTFNVCIYMVVEILGGSITYFFIHYLLKTDEIHYAFEAIRRILKKRN